MTLSRRTLLGAAVAGTATVAAGVPVAAEAAAGDFSPPGDLIGRVTVGYQGWYGASGDGGTLGWWHNAGNWGKPPSEANETLWAWPDMREYDHKYPTSYPNLGNGDPATLFSSLDAQTIDTHFRWMMESGIDTAALQRFNPTGAEGPSRDLVTEHVRDAAETHGRKFYVMYDTGGWNNMRTEMTGDWTAKMSAYTSSSAYAMQNGKPVVGIWGFGFDDGGHVFDAQTCIEVVEWFQAQGCYVMGGVPTGWRDPSGGDDGYPDFLPVYHAFDCIMPWMVTRISAPEGSDDFYSRVTLPDIADCLAYGVDYQPCVIPGDLNRRERKHGDFMWRQFYNVIRAGAPAIYVAMFDEMNESSQIFKTAESLADVPAGSKYIGLDEDGVKCTSDYYLRLTGDGGRMLRGEIALTATRPTVPWPGGTAQRFAPQS